MDEFPIKIQYPNRFNVPRWFTISLGVLGVCTAVVSTFSDLPELLSAATEIAGYAMIPGRILVLGWVWFTTVMDVPTWVFALLLPLIWIYAWLEDNGRVP